MRTNYIITIICALFLLSCESNDDTQLSETILNEYLQIHSDKELDEVIACAASDEINITNVYVYYYPITGSSEFRYYETANALVDANDFSNYTQKTLPTEAIMGGKLAKFNRTATNEAWGIVTYLSEGKVHKSNPIRLKQLTNPTEYTTNITVDESQQTSTKFTWEESMSMEDVIYFQALVESTGTFVSGTYTTELCFRYYDTSNVVLNINTETPVTLETSKEYVMNIMGVSEDNWVNIHARTTF